MAKEISTREAAIILRQNGFALMRSNGGHGVYSNGKRTLSIPIHSKCVNRMLFKRLAKENELVVNM